jgi:hypothetical protein
MDHFYIIYKIINKVNNKFYIGVHKTNNIHDDYYGSGFHIRAAIKKYGIENFEKQILHVFKKRKDAIDKEKELVNEELLQDPLCYNLTVGGYGGFHHIRKNSKHKSCQNRKIIHNKLTNKTTKVTLDVLQKYLDEGWELGFLPESLKRMSESGKRKIQSEEHRRKNSETKKDTYIVENIQTGKRKFVKKQSIEEYLKNGWEIFDRNKKQRGSKKMYNPVLKKCICVSVEEIDEYIKNGWYLGIK